MACWLSPSQPSCYWPSDTWIIFPTWMDLLNLLFTMATTPPPSSSCYNGSTCSSPSSSRHRLTVQPEWWSPRQQSIRYGLLPPPRLTVRCLLPEEEKHGDGEEGTTTTATADGLRSLRRVSGLSVTLGSLKDELVRLGASRLTLDASVLSLDTSTIYSPDGGRSESRVLIEEEESKSKKSKTSTSLKKNAAGEEEREKDGQVGVEENFRYYKNASAAAASASAGDKAEEKEEEECASAVAALSRDGHSAVHTLLRSDSTAPAQEENDEEPPPPTTTEVGPEVGPRKEESGSAGFLSFSLSWPLTCCPLFVNRSISWLHNGGSPGRTTMTTTRSHSLARGEDDDPQGKGKSKSRPAKSMPAISVQKEEVGALPANRSKRVAYLRMRSRMNTSDSEVDVNIGEGRLGGEEQQQLQLQPTLPVCEKVTLPQLGGTDGDDSLCSLQLTARQSSSFDRSLITTSSPRLSTWSHVLFIVFLYVIVFIATCHLSLFVATWSYSSMTD